MKSFALASAMIAAQASAARFQPSLTSTSRGFQEDAGRNGTSGQMARFSKGTSTSMTPSGQTDLVWVVKAWSVFYEDSGTTRLRLQHELTSNIFATDTVNFELAFRPKNQPARTDTATIGEDYVQCDMSQSSSDGAFWSASIAEGMYVCDGDDATDVCAYIVDDTKYT